MTEPTAPTSPALRVALRLACAGLLAGLALAAATGLPDLAAQGYWGLGFRHMSARLLLHHAWRGLALGLLAAGAPFAVWLGRPGAPRPGVRWIVAALAASAIALGLCAAHPRLQALLAARTYRLPLALGLGIAALEGLRRSGVAGRAAGWLERPLADVRRPLAVALLVPALALGLPAGLAAAWRPDPGERPSFLVVAIDTLRADHLGSYGYARPTSPALDRFAAESVRFERATTPRDKTTPSMAALFTGQYPHTNGVRELLRPLSPGALTLAERFDALGYHTFAVIGNYVLLDRLSGLAQGFELYDEDLRDPERNRAYFERNAVDLTDAAIDRLERTGERPFFGWLHYMDPHGPYEPAQEYLDLFQSPPGRELPPTPEGERLQVPNTIPRYQVLDGLRDVNAYRDRYDAEIRTFDAQFERLVAALRALGRLDDTWIVVTADHGEALGEQGLYFDHGHGSLYANVRVPLLIRPPGGVAAQAGARRVVAVPVELVDLFPTLAEIAGVEPLAALDGRSLVPLLDGSDRPHALAFSENEERFKSAQTGRWRLVWQLDASGAVAARHLYDLRDDPQEANDLYARRPQVAARLEKPLAQWVESGRGREAAGSAKMTDETEAQLRALGYVE